MIALAHHCRCGDNHAEANALAIAGDRARGATAFVTLEPCTHQGRTPPCVPALIDAGIARVVIGVTDQDETAAGGALTLRKSGVTVDLVAHQPSVDLSAPHRRRCVNGRPWVRCKWAQTLDGHVATRTGDSKWISNAISRRLVHRERGRVDGVLTGIGTVLADDCQLTVRNVPKRRTPTRIVLDRDLRTPLDSALVRTIDQAPLLLIARSGADPDRRSTLEAAGARVLNFSCHDDGHFDLDAVLRALWTELGIGELLVEAGPRLMGSLLADQLIDELAVFIAPCVLGDGAALPALTGMAPERLANAANFRLTGVHRRGGDLLLRYLV